MGYWRKHSVKELQQLLQELHRRGWRIIDPGRYYKVRCPCGGHYRTIHLTPSDPRYALNVLQWLNRQTCERAKDGVTT